MESLKRYFKPALTVLLTLLAAAMLVLSAWAFASPDITQEAKDRHQEMLQKEAASQDAGKSGNDEGLEGDEDEDGYGDEDDYSNMPW